LQNVDLAGRRKVKTLTGTETKARQRKKFEGARGRLTQAGQKMNEMGKKTKQKIEFPEQKHKKLKGGSQEIAIRLRNNCVGSGDGHKHWSGG